MRAHCVDLYDDRSEYIGDIWLSSAYGGGETLRLDASSVDGAIATLGEYQARQLRDALDAFLADRPSSPRTGDRTDG